VDAPGLVKGIRSFEGWFGAVKLRVVFGSRRQKITGFVSCDSGMDFDKTVLIIDRFKQVVFERTGAKVSDGEINVVTCELNEDRQDIRLDGLKSVTVKDFVGSLERIYNKGDGLRSEVKIKPQSLEHIYGVLKGGMTSYQILQSVGLLRQDIREQINVGKQTNRLLANVLYELKNSKVA